MAIPAILLSGDANIVQSMDFMACFSRLQYFDKEKALCEIMKNCRIVNLLCAVCFAIFFAGCTSPYIGKNRQEIVDIIAQEHKNNWHHSIQITFYHAFTIKLFSFAGLPGRKNNLSALDDRRAGKSLSPKTDAEDLNSFNSSS